jgi:1-phosphatidylinositol phosphodiesterase
MNQGAKLVNYHIPKVNPGYNHYICNCMKKILAIVSCLWLALVVVTAQTRRDNWMASLSDTMQVCRVSIPGTHDSGTAGVRFPMKHYARTQTMNLSEQWDAGIRFFDMRPRLEGGKLMIYHGPANCHLTFEEALLVLKEKIELNPTEFCIVMTNSAGGGQTAVDMTMELINTVIPARMLAVFKSDMTVADIRGRILFIHRNAPSRGVDASGVVVRGWPGNGTSRKVRMVSSDTKSAELWAQDYFTSGNNDKDAYLSSKWDNVYRLLQAFSNADDGVWCINHASGYTGTGVRTNIKRCSDTINRQLLDYLSTHSGPIGIIPMDFPAQELIEAIIRTNRFR